MVVEEVEETQTEQDTGSRGRELVFFGVFFCLSQLLMRHPILHPAGMRSRGCSPARLTCCS